MALQQQGEEVYEPLKRVRNFAISLLFVTIVLVSLTAFMSAKTIVKPIMTLTDVAERMSLGREISSLGRSARMDVWQLLRRLLMEKWMQRLAGHHSSILIRICEHVENIA